MDVEFQAPFKLTLCKKDSHPAITAHCIYPCLKYLLAISAQKTTPEREKPSSLLEHWLLEEVINICTQQQGKLGTCSYHVPSKSALGKLWTCSGCVPSKSSLGQPDDSVQKASTPLLWENE